MTSPEEMGPGPVVHDRRRIDPVTGQVRQADPPKGRHAAGGKGDTLPADSAPVEATPRQGRGAEPVGSAPGGQPPAGDFASGDSTAALTEQLAERTADLQRVQAEYANYRKRVDRDRTAVRELALAGVLTELLPALDAIGQAREHDELSGPFKSVAESLESAVAKLGLVVYGEKGEPFDPNVHEALTHFYSADVTEVTCADILQPGYRVGDRILRAARVAVAEPATGPDGVAESGSGGPAEQQSPERGVSGPGD